MFAWVRIIATSSIEGFNKFERGGSSFSAPLEPVEIQIRKPTTGTSEVGDHSPRDGFNDDLTLCWSPSGDCAGRQVYCLTRLPIRFFLLLLSDNFRG